MNTTSTNIKEIEQYFLTLSRKGIMLSSKDYNLITDWIEKGISKEQILTGIRNTFNSKDIKRIRSLQDCIEYVESTEIKKETTPSKSPKISSDNNNYLVGILNNFNNLIKDSSNPDSITFLQNINEKLKSFINSNNEEMFSNINRLEEEFFQNYPQHINSNDKKYYESEINIFINSGHDYINEKAKNKALNNFTKNFIIDNYLGFNPFEL